MYNLCGRIVQFERRGCSTIAVALFNSKRSGCSTTAEYSVYLVTGYSDLRKGIEGLSAVVQGSLSLDPFNKSLYLFCGRRRDRIKGLLWEGDGFLLLDKRLDSGVFRWPRNETEARLLSEQEIRWLLEGLEIEQPKAIKESRPGRLY